MLRSDDEGGWGEHREKHGEGKAKLESLHHSREHNQHIMHGSTAPVRPLCDKITTACFRKPGTSEL